MGPSQLVIQTAAGVMAKEPHGEASTGIGMVAWIAFVVGSKRTTVWLFGMPTQMLPSPLASQFGPDDAVSIRVSAVGPTVTVATILFVAGSMRSTVPLRLSTTHTAFPVVRTPLGAKPTGMVAITL